MTAEESVQQYTAALPLARLECKRQSDLCANTPAAPHRDLTFTVRVKIDKARGTHVGIVEIVCTDKPDSRTVYLLIIVDCTI
jgi:hypothetical protein